MNRTKGAAAVLILALAVLPPALAQSSSPNAGPGAPAVAPSDPATEATSVNIRSNREVGDPRKCLELSTNLEIIKCVETNWPYKRKKPL